MDDEHAMKLKKQWVSLKKEARLFPVYAVCQAWNVLEREIYNASASTNKPTPAATRMGKFYIGKITVLDPRLGSLVHSLEFTRLNLVGIQSPPLSLMFEYIQACERVHWILEKYRRLSI